MFNILALAEQSSMGNELIQHKIDQKTKPPGSLGQLEKLALQIAQIQEVSEASDKITIDNPTMLIFAADHGIAEEGVSVAPSEVTRQMVLNFLNGGAAINCFCRSNSMHIKVIDAGILRPIDDKRLIQQALGKGTKNFSKQAAMTIKQVEKGLNLGASIVYEQVKLGTNTIGFGEMGIGNTSSASAIMAVVLNLPVQDCVGRGTGIDDTIFNIKSSLIVSALMLHIDNLENPMDILACLGGFEIVQMVGAMLAAAEKKCILLIDGFIATAAVLVATKINKNVRDYMVFCHQSNEKGHQLMLENLNASPLLSLDLRLGEGTGAALALPIIQAAVSFYNDMASFEDAGVDEV